MTQIDSQTTTHRPAILELLSELEKRDERTKGEARMSSMGGAFEDPRGFVVMNTTGHDVGKVEDLYVDPNTRTPQFAVLKLGNTPLGIGDRHVLVAFQDVDITAAGEVRVQVAV